MGLIDSNIIIYASKPKYEFLRKQIEEQVHYVSVISKVEVLGYYKLKKDEYKYLKKFFDVAPTIKISDNIIERAISLRKKKNLSLGDSIIAASAIEYKIELVTRNTADFKNITGLKLFNPFND